MRVQQFSKAPGKPRLSGFAQPADRVAERYLTAVRGLLVAAALAVPIWLALYLLLR